MLVQTYLSVLIIYYEEVHGHEGSMAYKITKVIQKFKDLNICILESKN